MVVSDRRSVGSARFSKPDLTGFCFVSSSLNYILHLHMCCLSIAYHHISYHGCSSIFYVRKLFLQKKISCAKNKKSSNNKEEETGIDRFQSISSDFPLPTPFPPRLRWLVLNNNNNKMPLQAKTSSRRRKVYLYDLPSSLPSALVT